VNVIATLFMVETYWWLEGGNKQPFQIRDQHAVWGDLSESGIIVAEQEELKRACDVENAVTAGM
jgi:hypothetical protein